MPKNLEKQKGFARKTIPPPKQKKLQKSMIPAIGPESAVSFVLAVFVPAVFVLAGFVLAVFVRRISVLAVFVLADFVLAVFHFAGQRDNGGATGFGRQSQIPYVFPFGTTGQRRGHRTLR